LRYFYRNIFLLKKQLLLLFSLLYIGNSFSQTLYLKVGGKTIQESKTIDSIGYKKTFSNANEIVQETNYLSENLFRLGYLEQKMEYIEKINDSTFVSKFSLGTKTSAIHIYIGSEIQEKWVEDFARESQLLVLPIKDIESFMENVLKKLEKLGYSLSKVKLENFRNSEQKLIADLKITTHNIRTVNNIIINGYEKFPKNHLHNLNKHYKNKVFNLNTLQNLYADIGKYRFVKQVKYPEILFSTDSTTVYVYVEKTNSNRFDGFIGFSNDDESKLTFNGYLDLQLQNVLNAGEQFNLFWKNDGNQQSSFFVGLETPYLFKSPLSLKADLAIFRQDSTFQNTKTAIGLGYYFNYNSRFFLGRQTTESADIQNINSTYLNDFSNSFFISQYIFTLYKPEDFVFPEKVKFDIKIGSGSRETIQNKENQFFTTLDAMYHFYLNQKNNISLRSQNYYLKSDTYLTNELYRFGGINSIRGFRENNLQGNFFASILSEYRYIIASNLYLYSIIDYGYYQDQTTKLEDSLLGLGLGFSILTKNGQFNLIYANGSSGNQEFDLSNSIIQINFQSRF
jgi:hypothetical protein